MPLTPGYSAGRLPAASGLPETTPLPQQPLATPTPGPSPEASPAAAPYVDILNDKVKLEKGDRLTYRIAEDRGEVVHLTVNDAGDLDVPLLGHVRAAGKTCKQIAAEIKPLLEKEFYYKATVIIGLETHSERSIGKFYVMGQVRLPGGIDIPAGETLTVSKAIARAQGFSDYADKENVKLIRKTEQGVNEMSVVDVGAIIDKGLIDKDLSIQANDIIIAPEVKRFHSKVYVLGRVNNPSGLDMQENEQITVSKAIARCLGFAEYADKEKVKLLRKNVILPWFAVEDVLNPFGLANKVVSGNTPLCKYLKSLFSPQSLALLADPNGTKQQQKFVLIEEFNKVLQGVALDDDRRMDNVKLSSDALRLRAQNPKNDDLIRYNRMLLEDFFTQELKRNRPPEYQMFLVNVAEIMDQGRVDKYIVMEPIDIVIVPES
jgi:protein involved in polysaccharide export with SLBB domain